MKGLVAASTRRTWPCGPSSALLTGIAALVLRFGFETPDSSGTADFMTWTEFRVADVPPSVERIVIHFADGGHHTIHSSKPNSLK